MQKELEVWKKDNKKYALALKAEQRSDLQYFSFQSDLIANAYSVGNT